MAAEAGTGDRYRTSANRSSAMRRPDVPVGRRPAEHAATRPPWFRVGPPKLPFSLSNWPVSRRLSAVIVIAGALGVVFGGLRITVATDTAIAFARTTQLAFLGEEATTLTQAMEIERLLPASACSPRPTRQRLPYRRRI